MHANVNASNLNADPPRPQPPQSTEYSLSRSGGQARVVFSRSPDPSHTLQAFDIIEPLMKTLVYAMARAHQSSLEPFQFSGSGAIFRMYYPARAEEKLTWTMVSQIVEWLVLYTHNYAAANTEIHVYRVDSHEESGKKMIAQGYLHTRH